MLGLRVVIRSSNASNCSGHAPVLPEAMAPSSAWSLWLYGDRLSCPATHGGHIYGVTYLGGAYNYGVVFEPSPPSPGAKH
jgi:hypothetical protein